MSQSIEFMAINYHDGTPDKNCTNCNYHEMHISLGIQCERWGLPTKTTKICGEHVTNIHPMQRMREQQKETLF